MVAFWFAYVITRPLGASVADYLSKPHDLSGANFGDGLIAVVMTVPIVLLVAYLTVQPHGHPAARRGREAPPRRPGTRPGLARRATPPPPVGRWAGGRPGPQAAQTEGGRRRRLSGARRTSAL